ncbi:MAG: CapA family protein [Myxococcota bacterium]
MIVAAWLVATALAPSQHRGASERVTIAAVGDVLLHKELQRQAIASPIRFRSLWQGLAAELSAADMTYANLEGPMAYGINRALQEVPDPGLRFDDEVYTGWNRFNYPPQLADDLARAGFDVVSTANNHALDRGALGADRTLDALDHFGVAHTGTRRAGSRDPWHAVVHANGFAIAWLACAQHTNHLPDDRRQVLRCFARDRTLEAQVRTLAADPAVDAVIVTPHWGAEYVAAPNGKQRRLARRLIDAGALAVLGSHPHVLQPWTTHVAPDGHEGFIVYSLGNFVSHQQELGRRTSAVVSITLARDESGRARFERADYVPFAVREDGGRFFAEIVTDGPSHALVADLLRPLQ